MTGVLLQLFLAFDGFNRIYPSNFQSSSNLSEDVQTKMELFNSEVVINGQHQALLAILVLLLVFYIYVL